MSYCTLYEHACKNVGYEHAHIFIEKYFQVLIHAILYTTILRKNTIRSISLCISALKDSIEIYFIFFRVVLYF
jgi:hypothetical protein